MENPVKLSKLYLPKELFILKKLNLNSIAFETILWFQIKNDKYYDDGVIDDNGWLKNGKSHGPHKSYENGNVIIYNQYKNNKKHGECIQYFSNGNIERKEYYKNDYLYHRIIFYSSGKIRTNSKFYKDS